MKSINKILLIPVLFVACQGSDPTFDASGTFEAVEVMISSEVSGTLESFDAQDGMSVRKGQLLGVVDSTQLHLKKKQLLAQIDAILAKRPQVATQLAAYRVQLEAAEREQKRMQKLFSADAATQKQVDDAASQVSVIRRQMEAHRSSLDISSQGLVSETLPLLAQVEQLEDQLHRVRLMSPIDGTILMRYAEPFELVTPGTPLYKVADLSTLELRAYITGNQLPLLKLNQKVTVLVDNGSEGYNEFAGIITWISDKAEFTPKTIQTKDERADLVYAIKIQVENNGSLKIGMYGEVKF
jgi:HlyD family secretion protein